MWYAVIVHELSSAFPHKDSHQNGFIEFWLIVKVQSWICHYYWIGQMGDRWHQLMSETGEVNLRLRWRVSRNKVVLCPEFWGRWQVWRWNPDHIPTLPGWAIIYWSGEIKSGPYKEVPTIIICNWHVRHPFKQS